MGTDECNSWYAPAINIPYWIRQVMWPCPSLNDRFHLHYYREADDNWAIDWHYLISYLALIKDGIIFTRITSETAGHSSLMLVNDVLGCYCKAGKSNALDNPTYKTITVIQKLD
ncbi:hypothetical protein T01_11146 [Trichinella spiralis]|uniref:Uncharacterized protein n=1 Tax=Trichinella spiralis TaxID=6334 RepID=A0A0V1BVC1_TRISP|nr:hypothetical protein T01_11146 [Trichinella spiralis]